MVNLKELAEQARQLATLIADAERDIKVKSALREDILITMTKYMTVREIGAELGISAARVSQLTIRKRHRQAAKNG